MIFYKKYIKVRANLLKKWFSESKRKEETLIYILNDKFSIKPNQEYRIIYEIHSKNEEKDILKQVIKCGTKFD